MNYFSRKRPIFIVFSNRCIEEYAKIDKFIEILNKSGIGKLIENTKKNIGRRGYNPFNLVAGATIDIRTRKFTHCDII